MLGMLRLIVRVDADAIVSPNSQPRCLMHHAKSHLILQFVQSASGHKCYLLQSFAGISLQFPCLFDDVDGGIGPDNHLRKIQRRARSVLSHLRENLRRQLVSTWRGIIEVRHDRKTPHIRQRIRKHLR